MIALVETQEFELFASLYPFCNYVQAQLLRHGENRRTNSSIVSILMQVFNEGAVDLDRINREALQVTQR